MQRCQRRAWVLVHQQLVALFCVADERPGVAVQLGTAEHAVRTAPQLLSSPWPRSNADIVIFFTSIVFQQGC